DFPLEISTELDILMAAVAPAATVPDSRSQDAGRRRPEATRLFPAGPPPLGGRHRLPRQHLDRRFHLADDLPDDAPGGLLRGGGGGEAAEGAAGDAGRELAGGGVFDWVPRAGLSGGVLWG